MKSSILTQVATVFIAGAILGSCQSSAQKVENAQDKVQDASANVVVAQQELNQALKDSIQLFKKESEEKMGIFDKDIAEFKAKIASEKKVNKAKYEKKLASMEQKSSDMKKKLADFKEESQDKWTSFKSEFNHDMDELGKAFKDLTVKNVK